MWRVTAKVDNAILAVRDLTAHGCRMGEAEIKDPNEEGGVNRQGIVGYDWSALNLSRGSDSSLVVHHRSRAIGLMFLIPMVGSRWIWYRFHVLPNP